MIEAKLQYRGRMIRRFCSREEGQALVELALTVPILLLLFLGAAELARVAYVAIEVANAAKAAAQYAAQDPSTMSNTNGMVTAAAQDDAYNLTKMGLGMTVTPVTGAICSDGTAATPDSAATSGYTCTTGQVVPTIKVTTSVSFDPLIHLPFLPRTFTLSSSTVQNCADCQ